MMTPPPIRRIAILLVALALLSATVWAQPLLTIRVTSLDAALTDLERFGEAIGQPITKEEALATLESMLKVEGFENLDLSRPAAVVLPVQGMLLQAQGLITVVPVKDVDQTMALLGERFPGGKTEGGIAEFPVDETTTLFVRTHEGYLMAAANRQIAEDAVLSDLLSDSSMPPGNIGASLQIEPIAPMIQMSLMQAKGFMAAQAEKGKAAGEKPDVKDEAPEKEKGKQDAVEAPEVEGPDLQAMLPLMDFYFQLLNDFVNNTSAMKLSLELTGGHVLLHEWVVPRGSSTLAEAAAAQDGAFPKIAGFVDGRAPVVMAGSVKITPRMQTALESYADGYGKMVESLSQSEAFKGTFGGGGPGVALGGMIKGIMAKVIRCNRGDVAGSLSFNEEGGFDFEQIQGLSPAEGCAELTKTVAETVRSLPRKKDAEPAFEIDDQALTHKGVTAMRMSVKIPAVPEPEVQKLIHALYGGDSLVSFIGMKDSMMLSAMGPHARDRFGKLVDRIQSGSTSGGVTRGDFAPLAPTSGYYVRFDLASLFGVLGATNPELAGLAEALSGVSSNIVYGVSFGQGRAQVDVAAPVEMIRAFAEAAKKAKPAVVEVEQQAAAPEAKPAAD